MIIQDNLKHWVLILISLLPHLVDWCNFWLKLISNFLESKWLFSIKLINCSVITSSKTNSNKFYPNVPHHKESCAVPPSLKILLNLPMQVLDNTIMFINRLLYLKLWNLISLSSVHKKKLVFYCTQWKK